LAAVTLEGVVKRFGNVAAVDDVSLDVAEGEFLAVLGPSGCGKSTLLRLIAGFETVDRGTIRVGERLVAGAGRHVPPEDRRIGMVFQSYALWPHMSVAENIGYPLRVQRLPSRTVAREVAQALAAVGLEGLGKRMPAALSGGQRQRVALARCLAMKASVVLLDEPLANLDVHSRARMLAEIAAFRNLSKATLIYVTHDQAEALGVADRVAVMDAGRVRQVAPPATLYRSPLDARIGRFVGIGAVVRSEVTEIFGNGHAVVSLFGGQWRVRAAQGQAKGAALVCVRPEDLRVIGEGDGFDATVKRVMYQGGRSLVEVAPLDDAGILLTLSLNPADTGPVGGKMRLAIVDGWVIPGG
jgi:iron(III) transport system ATP-binding protein